MENVTEKLVEIKNAVSTDIDSIRKDVQNCEKEISRLKAEKPVDRRTQIRQAILSGYKGDQAGIKALDSGFLTEDTAKEILDTPSDGFDLLQIAYVKTVQADSTNIGIAAYSGLGRGAESASDFAAVSVAVAMPLAWQYLSYSQAEFNNASLNMADENIKAYLLNRTATLAEEFVSGTGTGEMKGLEAYSTTTTWETGKLQIEESADATADDLLDAIVAARNSLPNAGVKVLTLNGITKSILEADRLATGQSRFTVRADGSEWYENMRVWVNDEFDTASTGKLFGAVLVVNRGYGVGINPQIVVSSNAAGSKISLYTGQGVGGAILDEKCICGLTVSGT